MNLPGEQHWLRVEELSKQFSALPADQVAAQISRLAAAGESPTVLTLLGTWLDLPPPPPTLGVGASIDGRYTLLEELGHGGMGTVWRAKQELVGRDVALKMIHPELVTPDLRLRFLAEIEALGQLNHPGIARIFDAGFQKQSSGPPVPFFAMELVEGLSLDRWAAERRTDQKVLLQAFVSLCVAVQSAHEHGIVHRDLKPRNILVKSDGQPVVLDFGIARLAGVIIGEQRGLFSGTFAYAAPEQHLGCDGDFRSGESVDVYALGALLFEMFAGHRLFNFPRGATIAEMRRMVLEVRIPRLSETLPHCSPGLDDLISRSLRRDPADRYYSVTALCRAASREIEQMAPAVVAPPWSPAASQLVPGTQWRLVNKLGEGGAGQVWSARHEQLEELRVFKFCDSEDKVRTLKRELTLYRLLKGQVGLNPHFIQLHEVSLEEPPWYLMMDHVEALDLETWAERQEGGMAGLTEQVLLEVVAQAAEALQAAHEAGILHRDVKPANLLVRGDVKGADLHIFVTDFGVGQILIDGLLRNNTLPGFTRTVSGLERSELSGTLLYLAPEVLEGRGATARSDIYSLGVVLWQMLIRDFHAALDPANWLSRIDDPLLREDLARCLAGLPEKRWSSAGDFAAQLRNLPARRAAAAARQEELAARERAAYRQGVLKTAAIAFAAVLVFATVAMQAWFQSRDARRAHGELALSQAMTLKQTDFAFGRRERGIKLLEIAAKTSTNLAALRTASASVLGMSDLLPLPPEKSFPDKEITSSIAIQPREIMRAISHDGSTLAVARDLDGLNGTVDLYRTNGARTGTIERKQFPWVPLAEPELLSFSPDNQYLAVGGPASSHHVLIFNVTNASLKTYLFQGSDPLCCAWHPDARFIAVGCADSAIRIWDTSAGVKPLATAAPGNQFDLPPILDAPAEDRPFHVLRGQHGAVIHLAFSPSGRWLAALDAIGYLRIYVGYYSDGLPSMADIGISEELAARTEATLPVFAAEIRLDNVEPVTRLEAREDRLLIHRAGGETQAFEFVAGKLPTEIFAPFGIADLAWDAKGKRICAESLTDLRWFDASPLKLFQTAPGENPLGISCEGTAEIWAVAKDRELTEWRATNHQSGAFAMTSHFLLHEAMAGEAARTGLAIAGDGRMAVYYGKRIQFFYQQQPAPLSLSVQADGGGGQFQNLFWDRPGRLLGASFVLPTGGIRLETWETTTNFPPQSRPHAPVLLDCQGVVPANDGQHCLARGRHRGLWLLDPAHPGSETTLDTSNPARQAASFSCNDDGSLVAMVVDHSIIRLLSLPSGRFLADLNSQRQSALTCLAWDVSGTHLASVTDDGFIQDWNLLPWQEWLGVHGLQR